MDIGQKCKINEDTRIYKITDYWQEKKNKRETKNSIEYEIKNFVNLEEINNPQNIKTKISTVNIYTVE